MRFGTITLFVALGIAGTAACSGKGGAGTPGSGGPALNNGPYQAPPADYDSPPLPNPSSYDTPQTEYDPPPDQSEAGGTNGSSSVTQVCLRYCRDVLNLNCPIFQGQASAADCDTGCAELAVEIPCPGQFADAFACILDNLNLSCELFEEDADPNAFFDEEGLRRCEPALIAFASCAGEIDQNPPDDPPPGDYCTAPSCADCIDACEQCRCGSGNDPACDSLCEPAS